MIHPGINEESEHPAQGGKASVHGRSLDTLAEQSRPKHRYRTVINLKSAGVTHQLFDQLQGLTSCRPPLHVLPLIEPPDLD
ncbi:hypothetical protein D3C86_1970220 [compost metagenome]